MNDTITLAEEFEWALSCLSPYGKEFYRLEMEQRTYSAYHARLQSIGFVGHKDVLDLACGMGQWSLVMAGLNERVQGVDISSERLLWANLLARSRGVKNVSFSWAAMEQLPFEDERFDACFCYGAFMFGHGPRSLNEVFRVLKPGGRFYVNANGAGWYLDMLIERGIKKRQLITCVRAAQMFLNRLLGRNQNVAYTRAGLKRLLERYHFVIEEAGYEGKTGTPVAQAVSFYPDRLYGMDAVFEILARKPLG